MEVYPESSIVTQNKIVVRKAMHGSGTIVKVHEGLKPEKTMCEGCRDNYYNQVEPNGCWFFKNAKVVDKVGYAHINVTGGPDTKMVKTLSCWHAVRK